MLGSLQPLLFCIGMYFVVLIFSVFVCTSLYKAMKTKKQPIAMEKATEMPVQTGTTAMVTVFK